jgi:hypothetical protein
MHGNTRPHSAQPMRGSAAATQLLLLQQQQQQQHILPPAFKLRASSSTSQLPSAASSAQNPSRGSQRPHSSLDQRTATPSPSPSQSSFGAEMARVIASTQAHTAGLLAGTISTLTRQEALALAGETSEQTLAATGKPASSADSGRAPAATLSRPMSSPSLSRAHQQQRQTLQPRPSSSTASLVLSLSSSSEHLGSHSNSSHASSVKQLTHVHSQSSDRMAAESGLPLSLSSHHHPFDPTVPPGSSAVHALSTALTMKNLAASTSADARPWSDYLTPLASAHVNESMRVPAWTLAAPR